MSPKDQAIWDRVIAEQRRLQGGACMDLISKAAQAEETIPADELEESADNAEV